MITAAIFGGSIYAPYGFDTYNLANFPGGGISETSTTAGFSVTSNGQIYIATNGSSALWKGRHRGEINAPGKHLLGKHCKMAILIRPITGEGMEVKSMLKVNPYPRFDGTLDVFGTGTATFARLLELLMQQHLLSVVPHSD